MKCEECERMERQVLRQGETIRILSQRLREAGIEYRIEIDEKETISNETK